MGEQAEELVDADARPGVRVLVQVEEDVVELGDLPVVDHPLPGLLVLLRADLLRTVRGQLCHNLIGV
eukprot:3322924-Alexandrium_andersonii.AAC.1